MVFLKTPGGELNPRLIRLDFEVIHSGFTPGEIQSHKVHGKKLSGVGKGNVARNVLNSADFVASYGIFTVFHVSFFFNFSVLPFITSYWFSHRY